MDDSRKTKAQLIDELNTLRVRVAILEQPGDRHRTEKTPYEDLYNNALVGLFRSRLSDGQVMACNNRAAEMAGYDDVEEFMENYIFAEHYADPSDRERMVEEINRTGGFKNLEVMMYDRNGAVKWVRYTGRLVAEEGYIEGMGVDITQEKVALDAYEKERAMLERIIYLNPYGIAIYDSEGRFVSGNQAYIDLFGDAPPHDYTIFNDPILIAHGLADELDRLKDGKIIYAPEIWYNPTEEDPKSDRQPFCIRCTAFTVADSEGEIEHFVAMLEDITEQRLAEKKLEDERHILENIINLNPHSMAIYDSDGHFVRANLTYYKLFEAPPPPEYSVFEDPALCGESCREMAETLLEGKPVKTGDIWYDPHDTSPERPNKPICLNIESFPIMKSDDEIEYIIIVHEDVTERRQAEKILRENEARYRAIVEDQTEFICRSFPGGIITFVNTALARSINRSPDELIGESFFNYMPEDDVKEFQSQLNNLTVDKPVVTIEHRVIAPYGEIYWSQWTNRGIFDEHGNIIEYQAVGRDITNQKIAEAELRKERDRAQNYLDIAEVILLVINQDGEITLINRKGCSILGYEEEELIGKNWFDTCLPKEMSNGVKAVFNGLMDGKETPFEHYDNSVITKSGEERLISWHNAIMTDDSGNIIGTLSSGEDITEQKKAEGKLRQASRMEATATLAAGIAHDFNNLMVGVLGNAELLKLELGDMPDAHDKVFSITKAAQQAGELAQQMLAFARGGKYQPRVVNLNDIIRESLRLHERSYPVGIVVSRDLEDKLANTNADPTQIEQVVMNLCMNAVESIDGKGTITIRTRNVEVDDAFAEAHPGLTPGNYICLSIEDTGSGIKRENMARIFEPFFTTKFKGRGLGLAAAYGIIKNHDGLITVYSEVGQGAVFRIYLPSTEVEVEKQPAPETGVPKGSETILVIDDEETVVDVTKNILKLLGYEVLEAYNGQEAVDLLRSYEGVIHLAVLDMGMPVMDGSETYPYLKEERPSMKVLICSGYELDEASQALIDAGAAGFIQKPFSMIMLGQQVRKALDG